MLESSARLIGERVGADALVLDVGGGARPFPRADWVIDILPYEARGMLGWDGDPRDERFGPGSWVCRDICDREPWPFADRQFDFAVCSHTLEDVRDPVWVSMELERVAAAGYIEVPTLREELTYGIHGPWVGWSHHRWLVLVEEGTIEFLFKHHVVNRDGSHLPAGSAAGLTAEERVQMLWWEGHFDAREWLPANAQELDGFLERFVAATPHSARRGPPRGLRRLVRRR